VYEVIETHDAYWDRFRFIEEVGLYTGQFGSPDYDWAAPGEDVNVFSVGLNSTLHLFKTLKARMARELGKSDDRPLAQAAALRRRINKLMWDEAQGFYFNYDACTGAIFQTSSPDYFLKSRRLYKLHNLISLYGGVPDAEQAQRMMRVVYDDFPECYDPTHGYLPEENPNVGGVGTISVPLLLVLDRIGLCHSCLPDQAGLQTRPVKESGIGDVSFRCHFEGQPSQVAFTDGCGLAVRPIGRQPGLRPGSGGMTLAPNE
jgi:hypothetical protein